MKKTALILALVVALSAVGAYALEASDVLGAWYLTSMEMDGASLNPANMGMEMSMTLHENGRATLSVTGQDDSSGVWTLENGALVMDDGVTPIPLTMSGNTLVAENAGTAMVFSRERAQGTAAETSPVRAAAGISEFNGSWTGVQAEFMGSILPLSTLQLELSLTIAEGTVQMRTSADGTGIEREAKGEFRDGALAATFADAGLSSEVMMELLHDGTLTVALEFGGTAIKVFCQKERPEA